MFINLGTACGVQFACELSETSTEESTAFTLRSGMCCHADTSEGKCTLELP